MKSSTRTFCMILCLVLVLSMFAACGRKQQVPEVNPIIIYVTPAPAATPEPAASSEPTASVEPVVTPLPTATPVPTDTPAPATPTPTVAPSGPPTLTKSPTDERLNEGGTCLFVARADNATSLIWHLVSPDGKTDITYDMASSYFSQLSISGGKETTLRLSNVPAGMNGWHVYCRFSNNYGSVSSGQAIVSVNPTPTPAPTATPKPTPAPTATPAPTPTPTPAPAPQPDYAGQYHDSIAGRASMTITPDGSRYNVFISWSSSASEHSEWSFTGTFDSSGSMYYSDGVMTNISYDDDGIEHIETMYSGGSGCLTAENGGLRWQDFEGGSVSVLFVK